MSLVLCLANNYSLLMCQSTEDLKNKAEWDGAEGHSRHHLLSELSSKLSVSKRQTQLTLNQNASHLQSCYQNIG